MKSLTRIIILIVILAPGFAWADTVHFSGGNLVIGKHLQIYEDNTNALDFDQVIKIAAFKQSNDDTPNMGLSQSTFWLKFAVQNNSSNPQLFLELAHPFIHSSTLYLLDGDGIETEEHREVDVFSRRDVKHQNLIFHLNLKPGATKQYYLKVKGFNQVIFPLIVRDQENLFESSLLGETINGFFVGIILVMVLYNLFIYVSTKDKSYLFYVLYVLSVGLAQTSLSGYAYKYFWPYAPKFNSVATIWFSGFAGVFAMLFIKNFLQLPEKWPKGVKILNVIIVLYSSTGLLNLAGFELLSFRAVDVSGMVGAVGLFVIGFKLSRENYRPAKLFLTAWTMFLLGLALLVLRNINVLPYNILTTYTMQIGTIMEVVLLSIALADKINILKREKEESQENALRIAKENALIIKEQNVSLELKVKERTIELSNTNEELSDTLNQLRDAQTQIIESEKMASLGQLTAGIAHEINNPINFVSSNIRPLRRDIDDILEVLDAYGELHGSSDGSGIQNKLKEIENLKNDLDVEYLKTELGILLKGMEDGAQRTVEIVKGLKLFARVDDLDLNMVDINAGIESTLVILNYQMSAIQLVSDLGNIPNIEGFGGKLNQVFMNILTNSIYVIEKDTINFPPTIWVKTWLKDSDHICISIRDNGSGMTPEVKAKIFDPFFTTKQVGDGTGLGLSIVFKIIEVHSGHIAVNTEVGKGTEFIITLPIVKKKNPILAFNE